MRFTRSEIPDVIICEPIVHGDSRGYFIETYRQDKLNRFLGHSITFVQDNESKSNKGVLRGLHYQLPPFAQTKLVRVIEGVVLDIALDIRKGSPTFGNHVSIVLSAENQKQLLIPRGFAHGFIVLSNTATFAYKVDNFYSPEHDRGILYDGLNINWILENQDLQLSVKDLCNIKFDKAVDFFDYEDKLYD